ncbi:BatD family protein [Niabella aquatica]
MRTLLSIFFILLTGICRAQGDEYVSLQDRLKSNIFLKVEASSTDVFVGEPITVTYKLYSAMASESNIVKRPSFDGFDIKDLMGEADITPARENVDGVVFDVHTILKLQLTPYKAGRFILGALTMRNRVRLVDANGNKDPVLDGVSEDYSLNNGYYTLQIASVPLSVLVTALPAASQPQGFDGVTGDFKMNVELSKVIYAPGEQGHLTITFLGKGDFSKVKQPEINWPGGVEVFPSKIDEDKAKTPEGNGYKSFTIPFKAERAGRYTIPSVQFTFFDVITNQYKTITNIPVEFNVVQERNAGAEGIMQDQKGKDNTALLIAGAVILGTLLLLFVIRNRKNRMRPAAIPEQNKQEPVHLSGNTSRAEELLKEAGDTLHYTGDTFYVTLKRALTAWLEERLALPQNITTNRLIQVMTENRFPSTRQNEVISLLNELDMNIYSGGGLSGDKERLLNIARNIILNDDRR